MEEERVTRHQNNTIISNINKLCNRNLVSKEYKDSYSDSKYGDLIEDGRNVELIHGVSGKKNDSFFASKTKMRNSTCDEFLVWIGYDSNVLRVYSIPRTEVLEMISSGNVNYELGSQSKNQGYRISLNHQYKINP